VKPPTDKRDIRVLVIDDSAFNRQTITSILTGVEGIRVVARAGDGNEGLKQVFEHEPDVITLDLEMPRMDGFTLLRILMRRRPTPVIVISSYAKQENVFKALELGALDFIAKPTKSISRELRSIEAELVQKVKLIGRLRQVSLSERAQTPEPAAPAAESAAGEDAAANLPLRVVCMGASTGGPPALKQVLAVLPAGLPAAMVISQHMPASFTGAFAERLDKACPLEVREARSGDRLRAGLVLVAPGSASIALERHADGGVRARVETLEETTEGQGGKRPRFVPSINRMMTTAAKVLGSSVMGVVLTGMGDDGAAGIKAIKGAGGATVAESAETAVIFGMPEEAIATGAVDEVCGLSGIAEIITRHARSKPES
jgi:two-component system chemotaxis response regulator CheB